MSHENDRRLVPVLLGLTVVTGMVDGAGVLGLGRVFTANMTGNVVLLGFAAAGTPGLSFARTLAALLSFGLGAWACGRLVREEPAAPLRTLAVGCGAEGAMLL